jgi:excisionase family DNA binding protein
MEKRWISPKQAAEFLSLHQKTIYSLISRGEIPAAKIGGSVRVDLRALEAKMEEQLRTK